MQPHIDRLQLRKALEICLETGSRGLPLDLTKIHVFTGFWQCLVTGDLEAISQRFGQANFRNLKTNSGYRKENNKPKDSPSKCPAHEAPAGASQKSRGSLVSLESVAGFWLGKGAHRSDTTVYAFLQQDCFFSY